MALKALLTAVLCCLAIPAVAQDHDYELRLGGAISGAELGQYFLPDFNTFQIANLDSLQVEAIFGLPDTDMLQWIGTPRFELGGVINLRGRESLLHAGLNWHFGLFDTPLFVELGAGGTVHNGSARGVRPLRDLGCNFAFHYSWGVGVNLPSDWTVVGKFQHSSHGGLCGWRMPNQGLNNFGVVVGKKF